MCVRGCMHACVRACVRGCVRACVRVCVRVCVHACVRACVRACMCVCVHVFVSLFISSYMYMVFFFLFFVPHTHTAQLEMDVKESMLSMAKQCGKVDPDVSPRAGLSGRGYVPALVHCSISWFLGGLFWKLMFTPLDQTSASLSLCHPVQQQSLFCSLPYM